MCSNLINILKIPLIQKTLFLIAFLIPPIFLADNWISLLMETLIMVLVGVSLNLLVGNCGLISFGQAGFFAVGAYAFGLLSYYHITPFVASFFFAIVAIFLFAAISGWFVVRLVEIYFALIVFSFSQIVFVVVSVWYSVTSGDDGLNGIPIPGLFFSHTNCYYLVAPVVIICVYTLYRITESPFGKALNAIRDNRMRASFIGLKVKKYIYIAYMLSATFSGIAGILLVLVLHAAFPHFAGGTRSSEFLFICLIGGMYNFSGPIVGAFLYMILHFLTNRYISGYWPMILGLSVVSISLFFRGGVVGSFKRYFNYIQR